MNIVEFELGQCGDGPGARHGLGSVQSGHHIACSAPLLRDTRHTPPAAGTPDPGTGTPHSLAHRQKPVEYVTVSLEYSHGISVIQTLSACIHLVAQCAALSNYPGSLVTSPGARLSPASSARPGAGGEYTEYSLAFCGLVEYKQVKVHTFRLLYCMPKYSSSRAE